MSRYTYHPSKVTYKWDSDKEWLVMSTEDTLHDREEAFTKLRKETAVECDFCVGTGLYNPFDTHNPLTFGCVRCDGSGLACSFCYGSSKSCTCGEANDE